MKVIIDVLKENYAVCETEEKRIMINYLIKIGASHAKKECSGYLMVIQSY